jgi:hypothetical protein
VLVIATPFRCGKESVKIPVETLIEHVYDLPIADDYRRTCIDE